jgi:hypothetical protein
VFPTSREYLTSAALPPDKIAPPETPAEFVAKELVVTVSGPPLSTTTAPPLALGAWLLIKLDVLMLYTLADALKSKRSNAPPPAATEFAVLPLNVDPDTVKVPTDGNLPSGSPAENPTPPPLALVEFPLIVLFVIVRLPPACEIPPPPKVPAPVAEFPEITQLVRVNALPTAPEIIPPPPTPVLSLPPEIVTSEIVVVKLASKNGFTSITRSPPLV